MAKESYNVYSIYNKKAVLSQGWLRDAPYTETLKAKRAERLGTQLLPIFAVTSGVQRRQPKYAIIHLLKIHVQTSITSLSFDRRYPWNLRECRHIRYISRNESY